MAHIRGSQPQRLSSGRPRRVNMEPGFQTRGRYSKKRKKTVLVLGIAQVILGLVIIGISFSVFALTSASRIRHASPCWAGFALLFTGGVGVIAWRQPSSLSLGFYTVLSCLCILLHLVATTLAGLGGMELQTVKTCMPSLEKDSCLCCTSILDCNDGLKLLMYTGTTNCHMLEQPVLRDIMFANCVTNILAIVLCITTSSVGFILALKRRRTQRILSHGYINGHHGYINNGGICSPIPTGDAHEQFFPIPFLPPPYAPPHYNEISYDPVIMQSEEYAEANAASHIFIDPGELPPPYSTLDYSHSRSGRRSRSSRGSRSSRVLENPHSDGHTGITSTPVPPSHISRGCSTDAPPPPPIRWDIHGVEVHPFCVESHSVTQTIAMGRGLVSEYPGRQELVSEQPSGQACSEEQTVRRNNLDKPDLYITENPLVPLTEAKTPLQIHMATRCQNMVMYNGENRPIRETRKPREPPQGKAAKLTSDRGRRHSHTGGKGLAATDGTRPKKEGGARVKRRRSRRTRSLQSASSGSSRQYSSSSDSEEERLRAANPRRKPHKTSSNSEESSLRGCSDCMLPSTSESTINRHSCKTRCKSGSDMTSFSRESVHQGLLCTVQLASSERLTLTDNSSLEERLMALRQSYDSLTSAHGTLVDTASLRPDSLGLNNSGVKEGSLGSSSPNSEFSNPWILRSRSNTSEGVSFASSSITLTSETSGASNEMKHSSDHTYKQELITTMQNGLLPPLPVSYHHETIQWSETKTPLILDNSTLPFKEDNTLTNCFNDSLQSKLNCLSNLEKRKDNSSKTRTKSVAEVNHETRIGLKQLLLEIEEHVDSPIKTLLNDIQGMLKSDEHCLVDLQHSANIVNHFLNQNEVNGISKNFENLHIANKPSVITSNTAVLKSLELSKETVL